MGTTTTIEWTDSSWNPVTGCTKVSPGCDHCYAETFAERFRGVPGNHFEQGFDLKLWPDRLTLPLHWRKPRKIFVNSMSDLFHQEVPDDFIAQVFAVMNEASWHTFQILTKRPSRAVLMAHALTWTPNIWMGTSIENDSHVWRAEKLRQVPAAVRFISAEPLLGELTRLNLEGIAWLIAGAESGHGARPMDENWVRFLRDRCVDDGVAFFYKQNARKGRNIPVPELDGRIWTQFPVPAQYLGNVYTKEQSMQKRNAKRTHATQEPAMQEELEPLLDMNELMQILRVRRPKIYDLMRRKGLPSVMIGDRRFFIRSSVWLWVKQQESTTL